MRLEVHGPDVVVQRGHSRGAAPFGLERVETVKGPDVENRLSLDIGNTQAIELGAQNLSALPARRREPVADVDGVEPERHGVDALLGLSR